MAVYPYVTLDVFTDRPLAGNQLAVFTDAPEIPEELLQPLAAEMALSETVFLYPPDGDGDARIRIFTPRRELPFAGHPVLGSAVAVAIARGRSTVLLETGAGPVPVSVTTLDARTAAGRMRQPTPTIAAYPDPGPLLAALGVERSELPVEVYDNGVPHLYVTLADEDAVAALEPDLGAIARIVVNGPLPLVGVNAVAGAGSRWKTRMFAPADGVPEDPATGSAAGPLAVHLARHGRIAFGQEIEISQGAEIARPSTLIAVAHGTPDAIAAVEVAGTAVFVGEGSISLT